jgi:dTDP-4-amino-4,6-dideoxygalactose transaminase
MHPRTLKLVPPLVLDLEASDLLAAAACLLARDEAERRARAEAAFHDGAVVFLSVRSALCALLEAQLARGSFREGDEVLFSALTIEDMPRLAAAHGLIPVAVGVDPDTLAPDLDDLRRKVGPRTRALVVAHLFGGRIDAEALEGIARWCRAHDVLLVEDCAQAYVGPGFTGHTRADLSLFSFGTLKTATALGGAVAVVRDDALRDAMRAVQARWPLQKTWAFARKVARAVAFLSGRPPIVYGLLAHLLAWSGRDIHHVVRRATRGFPCASTPELLELLRVRPCAAQLAFLGVRLRAFAADRLARRQAAGEELRFAVPRGRVVGAQLRRHTYWLFPVRARDPSALRRALWAIGVDASGASNLTAIDGAPPDSRALAAEIVLVPAYPSMSEASRRAIAGVLRSLDRSDAAAASGQEAA